MTKKRILLVLRIAASVLGVYLMAVLVPWELTWIQLKPLKGSIQEEVDAAVDGRFDGMIVYVDKAGEPPAYYTAGWHDRDKKIPAKSDALFKIASIGKLYDALAITRLVHHKRLSFENTLADYFPKYADRIQHSDRITLRMMVQHRSGIPSFTDVPGFWEKDEKLTSEGALELILDKPANFEPDADYEYCNTNYLLLSMLIRKVTGYESHQQYIREAILEPAGLHETYGSIDQVDMNRLMSGYYVGTPEDIKTTNYASMVATARDVGDFLRALNDGSIFLEGEQDIYPYYYSHTGLIPGYQSIAHYHEDLDAVVVQFVNTADFSDYQHWGLMQAYYDRIVKILWEDSTP